MTENKNNQALIGFIIIVLGIIFLFDFNLGRLIRILWPLALIAVGLYILIRSKQHEHDGKGNLPGQSTESGVPGMFGDIRVSGLVDGVGALDKSLLFGDIVIDLTDSKLLDGENTMDLSLLFGDITVIAPEDFPLKLDLKACIGVLDYKPKRIEGFFPNIQHTDDNYVNAQARLFIKGRLCFGDIKIITISK
jgi:lia operon protein LiaF